MAPSQDSQQGTRRVDQAHSFIMHLLSTYNVPKGTQEQLGKIFAVTELTYILV